SHASRRSFASTSTFRKRGVLEPLLVIATHCKWSMDAEMTASEASLKCTQVISVSCTLQMERSLHTGGCSLRKAIKDRQLTNRDEQQEPEPSPCCAAGMATWRQAEESA